MKQVNRFGFTIVELIVVLVIIAVLFALILPCSSGWLMRAEVRKTATRGAQVAKSLYARNLDRSQMGWPETYATNNVEGIDWSSSDKYFLDMIGGFEPGRSNEYFKTMDPLGDVDFSFIGSSGGSGASRLFGAVTNTYIRTRFTERNPVTGRRGAHNAWCVTLGLNSSIKASVPFMFTKNLRFSDDNINSLQPYDMTKPDDPTSGPINESVDVLGGKKAIAVGIQGNVIFFSKEKHITRELFNPDNVDQPFIWPAGSPEPEYDPFDSEYEK